MSTPIEVVSVNSAEKGSAKRQVESITVDERGVVGDVHAGSGHRAVSLLSTDHIERFAQERERDFGPGDFGENITIRGLIFEQVRLFDRLQFGQVELEVTQRGKKLNKDCTILRDVGTCAMPQVGLFTRLVAGSPGGTIAAGDTGTFTQRPLRVSIVTLSDRASRGDYQDRSGPRVEELTEEFFAASTRFRAETRVKVIPDDEDQLRFAITEDEYDILLTTGGTGVGPRDMTPDVVARFVDKQVGGIFESIRIKCAAKNPNALLSRGVAGIRGTSLIYTLPGSLRAVSDYMPEIFKTLEHLLLMVRGIDAH